MPRKLTLGDFEDRFSLDDKDRLCYKNAVVETAVGLKLRDFILAVIVALIAFSNMVASWVNATKHAAALPQLSCPAPIVNIPPLLPAPASYASPPRSKHVQ